MSDHLNILVLHMGVRLTSRSLQTIAPIVFVKVFFTDSALWAGSVIESPCPFVCMCVTKVAIVEGMVLRILNMEVLQNVMLGS